MPSENEWQTKICKRIREEGGYAKKWASGFLVGVPDLVVVAEGHNWFVEVKKIDCVIGKDFKKKLHITPKQLQEIQAIMTAGGEAYVLVVFEAHKNTLKGKVADTFLRLYRLPRAGTGVLWVYSKEGFIPWKDDIPIRFITQLKNSIDVLFFETNKKEITYEHN